MAKLRKLQKAFLLSSALAGAALTDYTFRREDSVPSRVIEHFTPDSSLEDLLAGDLTKDTTQKIRSLMDDQGYGAITLDGNGNLHVLDDQRIPKATTGHLVGTQDSGILSDFYAQMPKDMEELVRNNVRTVVFSPDVSSTDSDHVNGLSLGDGIVFVDTQASDNSVNNPKLVPSLLAHEAQHEFDKPKSLKTLQSEYRAHVSQKKVLEHQLESDDDPILSAKLESVNSRIETSEFLSKFGATYQGVYPNPVILASHLLEGNVRESDIREQVKKKLDPSDKGYELYIASWFADVVKNNSRDDAIRKIHKAITNERSKGSLIEVSGASALKYLLPDLLKTAGFSDVVSGKGAHLNFGSSSDNSGKVGQGRKGGDSFSVAGLLSLDEMLKGKRHKKVDTRRKTNNSVVKLADVDSLMMDDEGTLLYPNRKGSPGPGFFRFQIRTMDKNNNGIYDGVKVFYGSRNVVNGDGTHMAAKVDYFDGSGNYLHSSLVWFNGLETGENTISPSEMISRHKFENADGKSREYNRVFKAR